LALGRPAHARSVFVCSKMGSALLPARASAPNELDELVVSAALTIFWFEASGVKDR
jgi:hypothetical protein